MQAIAGLVVLALAGDHLHSERQLLTIHKLRLLLKAIEEITPLITQVWDVLQRI